MCPASAEKMNSHPAYPILLLLFVASLPLSLCEIKVLKITSDSRPLILFEQFGFTHTGHVSLSVSDVSFSSSLASPDPGLLGFFILSQEAIFRLILESQRATQFCPLSSHYAHTLFTFKDLTNKVSFNNSYPVPVPAEYSLFFSNCNAETRVSMDVRTEMYNIDEFTGTRDYLPAGQTQLPSLYLLFCLAYVVFMGMWVYYCFKNKLAAHRIHLLMGALLVIKSLDLLCAAEDMHYVKVTGTPHGWDVLFYIFHFIKGILLFTVIVLVGTGWSFLKPFLQEREKKVLMIIIPLQVFANIALAVIGETGPFLRDWITWNQLFLIIDIVCCCAIIFPIVWSIKSLREASKTDGKAARTLEKLTLFRKFYMVVVGYLYFTRIVVFALEKISAYRYYWVSKAAAEIANLAFYAVMFYMFRPVEKNQYFAIDNDEEEAVQAALREEEFEL